MVSNQAVYFAKCYFCRRQTFANALLIVKLECFRKFLFDKLEISNTKYGLFEKLYSKTNEFQIILSELLGSEHVRLKSGHTV